MLDIKLKAIEEKLYEEILKTMQECDVPPMFACSVLKNVENKFQEQAMLELSFRLLKKEEENNKKEEENND